MQQPVAEPVLGEPFTFKTTVSGEAILGTPFSVHLAITSHHREAIVINDVHQTGERTVFKADLVENDPGANNVLPRELKPGDTTQFVFQLKSSHMPWDMVVTEPKPRNMKFEIVYDIGNVKNRRTIHNDTIAVTAAPWVFGFWSGIGAAVGLLARSFLNPNAAANFSVLGFLGIFLLTSLVAAFLVVSVFQKSFQSAIVIENFWGAAIFGFIIGFGGYPVITRLFSGWITGMLPDPAVTPTSTLTPTLEATVTP
jgi:hypothetical protein